MAHAAILHRLRVRCIQNFRCQLDFSFRRLQRRLQTRGRLVRVVTLDARQHALPIRTVFFQRVVLVIEGHFAVLIRLAVFRERDFLGLDLARFFLNNNADAANSQ